ncbi:hypothetical protein [Micromonospora tulbaghiae]|uniref:hypothetical protein n=1 Tax=Micromonospora tulbaghiae TaxID=479978 RepID=UPI00342465AD
MDIAGGRPGREAARHRLHPAQPEWLPQRQQRFGVPFRPLGLSASEVRNDPRRAQHASAVPVSRETTGVG